MTHRIMHAIKQRVVKEHLTTIELTDDELRTLLTLVTANMRTDEERMRYMPLVRRLVGERLGLQQTNVKNKQGGNH